MSFEEALKSYKEFKESLQKIVEELNERVTSEAIKVEEVMEAYVYHSFHTQSTHHSHRDLKEILWSKGDGDEYYRKLGESYKKYRIKEIIYDLSICFAYNTKKLEGLKILVIDDNPKYLEDLRLIKRLLGEDCEIYITKEKEWKKFLDEEFWKELINKHEASVEVKEIKDNESPVDKSVSFWNGEMFNFTHIIVDLLFEGRNRGNEIIRNFVRFRNALNREKKNKLPAFFDIIALSLSTDIEDIKRAIDEGAITYVFKDRIFQLPAYIAIFENYRKKLRGRGLSHLVKSRNFGKLYFLPESIRRKLMTEPFLIPVEDENLLKISEELAYKWINKIPKAELHVHMGGLMDDEIVFNTSLSSLMLMKKKEIELCSKTLCELYIEFLEPHVSGNSDKSAIFVFDAWKAVFLYIAEKYSKGFDEQENYKKMQEEENHKKMQSEENYKKLHSDNPDNPFSLNKILIFFFERISTNSREWKKKIENIPSEKLFFNYVEFYLKKLKNLKSIDEDKIVCIFNSLIGICEGRTKEEVMEFWWKYGISLLKEKVGNEYFERIKERFKKELLKVMGEKEENRSVNHFRDLEKIIESRFEGLFGKLEKVVRSLNPKCNASSDKVKRNYLKLLLKASSRIYKKEDEATIKKIFDGILGKTSETVGDNGSSILNQFFNQPKNLVTYLRPGIFSGSGLLKSYVNLFVSIFKIAENLIKDRVRYVEIRWAPMGYVTEDFSLNEVVQAFFDAADFASIYNFCKRKEFIQINYIITGKKHKSPEKLSVEISTAIMNRERKIKEFEKLFPQGIKCLNYKLYPSRIVGFDLAGYEKGSDLEDFITHFEPLFRTCSFITIHAGEEETGQYIWEAIYRLHSHRIGHGLRLTEHAFLIHLVRDKNIGIELCPISNTFTNPHLKYNYPLKKYIEEGVQCIINSDDPVFSGSNLSMEYVEVAKLYYLSNKSQGESEESGDRIGYLSKWEVLRLVKNSFKFAFLEKQKLRKLMKGAEEEVYSVILETEGYR